MAPHGPATTNSPEVLNIRESDNQSQLFGRTLCSFRKDQDAVMPIAVEVLSDAFSPDGSIPRRQTCDGENLSPSLRWSTPPRSAKEWILICEDPDAPRSSPFIHWILYNIPITKFSLQEGFAPESLTSNLTGARQGKNDRGQEGYMGPCPPSGHGTHHYHFQLFAIDKHLEEEDVQDRHTMLNALLNHVVGFGELVGTYDRK